MNFIACNRFCFTCVMYGLFLHEVLQAYCPVPPAPGRAFPAATPPERGKAEYIDLKVVQEKKFILP